jgi:hypothetical protein
MGPLVTITLVKVSFGLAAYGGEGGWGFVRSTASTVRAEWDLFGLQVGSRVRIVSRAPSITCSRRDARCELAWSSPGLISWDRIG